MRESPDPRALDTATWRKSSRSTADNGCVEIARPAGTIVGLRDSKAPKAGRLVISQAALEAFLDLARH